MSFEELLEQTCAEPNYEKIKEGFMYIIQNKDTYYVARFIEPFLSHVSSEHLNIFYSYLQIKQSSQVFSAVIHNMLNECRTNKRLLQVLELTLQKHL
jgi:hypothetical protein